MMNVRLLGWVAALTVVAMVATSAQAVTTGYTLGGLHYSSNFNTTSDPNPGLCDGINTGEIAHQCGPDATGWDNGGNQWHSSIRNATFTDNANPPWEGDGMGFTGGASNGYVGHQLHDNGSVKSIASDGSDGYSYIEAKFAWHMKQGAVSPENSAIYNFMSNGTSLTAHWGNTTVPIVKFVNNQSGLPGDIQVFDRNAAGTPTLSTGNVTLPVKWQHDGWHYVEASYHLDGSGTIDLRITFPDSSSYQTQIDAWDEDGNLGVVDIGRFYVRHESNHGGFIDDLEWGATNSPIPEPATAGLIAMGVATMMFRRRRA